VVGEFLEWIDTARQLLFRYRVAAMHKKVRHQPTLVREQIHPPKANRIRDPDSVELCKTYRLVVDYRGPSRDHIGCSLSRIAMIHAVREKNE
jgi:hypothetical protein